jgi:Active DUF488-N3 subclade
MRGEGPRELIARIAALVARDEGVTLLCSSACVDAEQCHRTLLKGLIEEDVEGRRG